MNGITVILNGYKRKDQLQEQIDALNSGTVKPNEILLWYNYPEDPDLINYEVVSKIPTALNNKNYGVWARFYFALNAQNPFVCVFDDDTIPGSRWLENCLETMKTHEGLLGTVGLLYQSPLPPQQSSYYEPYVRFGWVDNGIQNEETVQVDLVGHSWFFKKEWLSHMLRELPDPKYTTCGEDMHFSYMLQKYANIPTFVPPHPKNDKSLWGSIKGKYGDDEVSLWNSNKPNEQGVAFKYLMNEYFHNQRLKGWKLINEK
jgi:GT2 family glycosyltransferase